MPTVELTINGQTKRVEVGDGATPADIDEIAKSLSGGGEPAAAPAPSTEPENAPTALGRAQQQVEHIGRSYIEAGRRIGSEMFPNWISAPEGTPDPKDRTMLSRLGDLALVTSPVVAPELMLAGSGMSVASRALGAPQWLSDALGVGTELLTGGVQTVGAVKKAIQAPGKAAEAAQAATKAAEAARTGQAVENVAAGVGEAAAAREAVHGTAAAEGAAGISDAAATRKAAEDIEKLQTATPREAGTTIREAYPPAEAARRSAFQEGTYDKIAAYAKAKGLAATNQNAVGQTLAKSLETAEDEWGDLARTAESKQVKAIQEQLKSGAPVEWEDLDKAEKALQRINGPSSVRKAIADAKKGLLEGTPAAKALESADPQRTSRRRSTTRSRLSKRSRKWSGAERIRTDSSLSGRCSSPAGSPKSGRMSSAASSPIWRSGQRAIRSRWRSSGRRCARRFVPSSIRMASPRRRSPI